VGQGKNNIKKSEKIALRMAGLAGKTAITDRTTKKRHTEVIGTSVFAVSVVRSPTPIPLRSFMKKIVFTLFCIAMTAIGAIAQDWSEYSRGSDSWHRHNRDAMFRPWKYDRGGRLKKGHSYSHRTRHSSHRRGRRR
jgi:hypothetical protein